MGSGSIFFSSKPDDFLSDEVIYLQRDKTILWECEFDSLAGATFYIDTLRPLGSRTLATVVLALLLLMPVVPVVIDIVTSALPLL
jgi:hypothetical protein